MKTNKSILLVEDDLSILLGVEDNLKTEGYIVKTATNGNDGLNLALEQHFDLLILDIMLPGLNGFEICKKMKLQKPLIPIIMLTARSEEIDKVAGLDYGADDYITKPFSLSELLARIRAILRRAYPKGKDIVVFKFDKIQIDFKKMIGHKNGKEIPFTKKELLVLKYLIQHDGEVVHRHDLLNKVWGYNKIPTTRTVDNFIMEIRKKIETNPSKPKYILSVSGLGYKFVSKH